MKIEIDLNDLDYLELSPNEYVALYKLYKNTKASLGFKSINKLTDKGYLVKGKITDKTKKLFIKTAEKNLISLEDAKNLCKKYIELFPKGVKTSGYPVKSSVDTTMIKKMRLFIKDYKYTENEILAATILYVNEKQLEGFSHMMLAKYFIDKKGSGSMLADYCMYIKENPEEMSKQLNTIDEYNINVKF